MTATFAIRTPTEVYVFVRGRLVYKHWLRTGVSALFQVAPHQVLWKAARRSGQSTSG